MAQEKSAILSWSEFSGTIFLGVVGLIFTYTFNKQQTRLNSQQESNREAMEYMQLMSSREQSEIDFRQKVYAQLGEKLLDTSLPLANRLAMLRLFEENFSNTFNVRLFFDALAIEAEKKPARERRRVTDDLMSIARKVKGEQELLIGTKGITHECVEGESETVHLPFTEGHKHHEGGHKIEIALLRVEGQRVRARVAIDGGQSLSYEISLFDEPLTDNTLLQDGHRFAITLDTVDIKQNKRRRATLNFLEFPADFSVFGGRPTFGQVNERLVELVGGHH